MERRKKPNRLEKKVQSILSQVKENKDEALYKLTQETDKISLKSLKVPLEAIQKAAKKLSSTQKSALELAAKNIRSYHEKTKPKNWTEETAEFYRGQIFSPISKVGIYIPGGLTGYPSTVLMNCIPAQIAGVESIQVVSPPTKSGLPHSSVLAALDFLGISKVFAVGGAQAVAALCFEENSLKFFLLFEVFPKALLNFLELNFICFLCKFVKCFVFILFDLLFELLKK